MELETSSDLIINGWFMEKNNQWPGQALSLQVEEVVVSLKSKFQDVLVFRSKHHGVVLVLDGVIQCTEFDEYTYQEMMAFIPLNCHPNPKNVLIIGGGDGGVAREVVKHPSVQSVTLCEIDEEVINVCKRYLPYMASSFDHPKMNLNIGDGFEFIEKHKDEFDVIISDTSDPVGPAERLFSTEYYKLMHSALKEGGVFIVQGECMFLHHKLIRELLEFCGGLYRKSAYGTIYVPTYPCGQIGFIIASKDESADFVNPKIVFSEEEKDRMKLRYYDEEIHKGAFVLPREVKKSLKS